MTSPFLYLFVCSAKNRVLSRLRRLREPKYAVGAFVGIAYLYFVFLHRFQRSSRRPQQVGLPPEFFAPLQGLGTLALWFVVLVRWIVPVPRQPLELSASERDYLLPAPLERRRIIRYKLLRSLVGILFTTAVVTLVARSAVPSPWSLLFGAFVLFTTLRLHLLGVALSRRSLFERGTRRDPAAVVALVVMIVATAAAAWALAPGVAHVFRTRDVVAAYDLVRDRMTARFASAALLPFSVMLRPLGADWPRGFAAAIPPALVLALLNYLWVLRAEGASEEMAEVSEKSAVRGERAPARPVYRRAPFALATSGRPEWALVWKNLILLGRYATPRMLLRVALPVVALAVVAGTSRRPGAIAPLLPLTMMLCCGLAFLGPYSVRNDLRQDLLNLSMLKTWPISGERLLWGEVLAPTVVLTLVTWLLVLVVGALSLAVPVSAFGWTGRLAVGLSALLVFPVLILVQIVIQNAAVVLFPGWVAVGPARPRGIEAMGQQMLMFAGTVLVLALGVLPGFLAGAVIVFLGYPLAGWLAVLPAALVLAALLMAEVVLAVHLLGQMVERTDPTAVGPA